MDRLIVSDGAQDDLEAIDAYVSDHGGYDAADKVIARLYRRFERLASLPGTLGTARPELRDDLRSIPESGYIIFFRYMPDTVEIVNVLHGSRDVITWYDTGDDQ